MSPLFRPGQRPRGATRHAWLHDRAAGARLPVSALTTMARVERRAGRLVDSRWTVTVAAAAAFLLRLPGLTRPVRADEAGFVLVARTWDPMPDSVYGAYFVDRPPLLIALFKVSDAIGGPLFIRVAGRGRVRRAGARGRGGGPAGRRRARRALDRGGGRRAQHQRAHRRGGGEGRAARAAGADGQPRAVPGRGPRPLLAARPWPPGCWPGSRSASSRTWSAGSSSPRSSSSGRGGPAG